MKQCCIVNGIIQSVRAKEDAVKGLKFYCLNIWDSIFWMTGEECPVDIGKTNGT